MIICQLYFLDKNVAQVKKWLTCNSNTCTNAFTHDNHDTLVWNCQASVIFSVLSRLNKNLKWRTLKPSACHSSQTDRVVALGSWIDRVIARRQISVTTLNYSSVLFRKQQGNTSLRHKGMPTHREERERPTPWAPLLCGLLPRARPVWAGPARSAVGSTWGPHSGPRTFLCSIFAGFSLSYLLATAILDSFSLF